MQIQIRHFRCRFRLIETDSWRTLFPGVVRTDVKSFMSVPSSRSDHAYVGGRTHDIPKSPKPELCFSYSVTIATTVASPIATPVTSAVAWDEHSKAMEPETRSRSSWRLSGFGLPEVPKH